MFDTIKEALEELKQGKMIIVTDDESRENEGDLLMPIENATPENVNFMATYGRGLICAPLSSKYIKKLNLNQMKEDNQDKYKTA
ncbi:MAG: 3,4-dihydroxy-2-butanone-4-phosphate synthase, partial [Spiroplasma sp.]|nr:3,4-dihydroxy-2-butanone-4-phosphate synthase [Mycoplasmatales bacterium]